MAKKKNNAEAKAKAKEKKDLKKLKIPMLGVSDNIVFGDKEVWAYYKITTVPYDFLAPSAKANMANNAITALAALCQSEGKKVDGHILITNTPFDVKSWESQIDKTYLDWHDSYTEPYDKFMTDQVNELAYTNYQKPVVYLGIKLFNRASFDLDSFNVFEFGLQDAVETFKKGVSNLFVLPSEDITKFEEEKARAKEEEVFRIIRTGSLRGKRVTAEELLLTLKRQFYPAMPSPYLEVSHGNRLGLNDIALETGGVIENNYRYLKFSQVVDGEIREGYRATLSFARFPSDMSMPGNQIPFLYMPAAQGLPYTMNSRFTMIPHNEIKRDLMKKKMETDDELQNLGNSGQGSNSSIAGTVQDLHTLESTLEDSKLPWLNGAYRVTIEMPTFEELREAISSLKQEYSESDTTLVWTTGDQMDLFIEQMPGSNIKMSSFNQRTSLSMLGVSGFNIGGIAGDPVDEQLILTERGKRRGE